jgi:phosphoribosylformylglycinamidine cyclo-ligase
MIQEESQTPWQEMYKVFNMGHRMEIYVPQELASAIIEISLSFGVAAQIVGRVEQHAGKQVTIHSEKGIFTYN